MRRAVLLVLSLLVLAGGLPGVLAAGSSASAAPAAKCGLLQRKSGPPYRSPHFADRPWALYGDSISYEGWRLLAQRAAKEIAVDAQSGRRTRPTVDALRRDLKAHVPEVVVMAIGTNDAAYGPEGVREQVLRTRQLLPLSTRLLWMNVYVETSDRWRDVNAQIATVPGVEVVDWAATNLVARGEAQRSPLLLDGVHLNCAGGRAWAGLLDRALREPPFPLHR